jgi:branched-chain amino acid transport system ATP-binding protein
MLDEPAAGLSPPEIQRFAALVRRLRSERNMTILLVEHVIALVMDLCDRVFVLDNGMLIAEGEPRQIADDPRVRTAYLGEQAHA